MEIPLTTKYRIDHYQKGYVAYCKGITHCPYRRLNVAWKCWIAGNHKAKTNEESLNNRSSGE